MESHFRGELSPSTSLDYYVQSLTHLLAELKHVFDQKDSLELTRVAAYEKLAEISKIMRVVLEKYSLIRSKELLMNASNLVCSVKMYNYDNYSSECHSKLIDAINKLSSSFQSSYRTMESMPGVQTIQPLAGPSQSTLDMSPVYMASASNPPISVPEEKIFAYELGLDELLKQTKAWSKYLKDIMIYVEKRVQVEVERNRNIIKNAQNLRTSIHNLKSDKAFLPFNLVYNHFLDKEIKNATICLENFDLLTQNIVSPINDYRLEFDKQIKKIKEDWARENKQLNDTVHNFSKSRELYWAKKQDVEKIRIKTSENAGEWNTEKIEKKRRTSEEAASRMDEAGEHYTKCMLALKSEKEHWKKVKRDFILRIRDMMSIMEMKIKEISTHYFETLRDSVAYSPEEVDKFLHDLSQYEKGKSYSDFANSLPIAITRSPNEPSFNHLHRMPSQPETGDLDSSESDNNSPSLLPSSKSALRKDTRPVLVDTSSNYQTKSYSKNFKHQQHYQISVNTTYGDKPKRIFGVPLTVLSPNNAVPDLVRQCTNQVEQRGSSFNGIYRIPAVKSHIVALVENYEANPSSVDFSSLHPNLVANLLKHFFRMLPDPLLTFQLYQDFISIAMKYPKNQVVNEEDIVTMLQKTVSYLSPVHYNTLQYFMFHLKKVADNSPTNQMTSSNLGIILGPTLIKKKNDEVNVYDTNHQGRIIELLITYVDRVFESRENDSSSIHSSGSFTRHEGAVKPQQHPSQTSLHTEERQPMNADSSYRITKSATCSSFLSHPSSQSKQHMVEARRQFFTSDFNSPQPPNSLMQRFKPNVYSTPGVSQDKRAFKDDSLVSPFSQIAASSNSPTSFNKMSQVRIKRVGSSGHHPMGGQMDKTPNKIYSKHNELSKSSSDIYTYKSANMSITSTNEDLV